MTSEDDVRRMLADARHRDEMPAEVAARLEAAIAAEADEGTGNHTRAPMPARWRRYAITAGLVAAAAVVVIGVGVPAMNQGQDAASSADTAGAPPDRENALSEEESSGAGATDGDRALSQLNESGSAFDLAPKSDGRLSGGLVPVVRRHQFDADVRRVLTDPVLRRQPSTEARTQRCETPDRPRSNLRVAITYRDRPSVLLAYPRKGDVRRVDVFSCATQQLVRTTTLDLTR